MGRKLKSVLDVFQEFSEDFKVIDNSLLLCKYCNSVVNWRKKTRITEHMNTRMHIERKLGKRHVEGVDQSNMAANMAANMAGNMAADMPTNMMPESTLVANQPAVSPIPNDDNDETMVDDFDEGDMNASQQYCLKWNNHQNNLLRVFSRLLGSEQFTDVLLATEGQTIRAHKMVLSACSSYFENLFMAFNEKNQIVILKDTSFADIAAIVEFMYKGEINVAQDQLSSLLKTAENLKVKGLAEVSGTDSKPVPTIPTPATPTPSLMHLPPPVQPRLPPLPTQSVKIVSPETNGLDIPVKRKRGRPRTLDSPGEVLDFAPKIESVVSGSTPPQPKPSLTPLQQALATKPEPTVSSTAGDDEMIDDRDGSATPTPGGPLTPERIKSLGIVKMNDYLVTGTRQQFWEEYFIKVIMQAVRNKEVDMKGAAELLGVSYGTLYGRYRETFGYLKHAWNVAGRPPKFPAQFSPGDLWNDPKNIRVLEQMKTGRINIKQAAEMLGMEPAMLAYQLAGTLNFESLPSKRRRYDEFEMDGNYDELMEVQPDIIINDEEGVDPTAGDDDQSGLIVTDNAEVDDDPGSDRSSQMSQKASA